MPQRGKIKIFKALVDKIV